MLTKEEIKRFAKLNKIKPYQQEKHYIQTLILRSIYSEYDLVFKGGTALMFTKDLPRFSEDLDFSYQKDKELTSKDKGYSIGTRRALLSRLEAAKSWGILSKDGTSLAQICKEGVISVIDISFLDENVSSLVIGMLARKILNARKRVTRQASMEKYIMKDIDELLDVEIPPTWLSIDEAHTLIPSGGIKTAASNPLIEYVKQGRRPGCSLVFATQQPSAIDTKVLSQLDILITHKLVFDEDLKAVLKRTPTLVPKDYRSPEFIRTLPIGIALIGDRSEQTSRAFVEINKSTEGVSETAGIISSSAADQKRSIDAVSKSLDRVSGIAIDTSTSAAQSAESAKGLLSQMQELISTAQDLANMSQKLQTTVGRFDIGDDGKSKELVKTEQTLRTKQAQRNRQIKKQYTTKKVK